MAEFLNCEILSHHFQEVSHYFEYLVILFEILSHNCEKVLHYFVILTHYNDLQIVCFFKFPPFFGANGFPC